MEGDARRGASSFAGSFLFVNLLGSDPSGIVHLTYSHAEFFITMLNWREIGKDNLIQGSPGLPGSRCS